MESLETNAWKNEDWLAGLSGRREETIAALRARIRQGLGAALAGRADARTVDLDDLTQESVLRVLDRLDTFRGDSAFTTWAMAVAIRVSLTTLRRQRAAVALSDERLAELAEPESVPPAHDADDARNALLHTLRRAITEALTPRQRQVILAELDGTPQVVLADRLSASPGAIYKMSYDARKKLKATLERSGFDTERVTELLSNG